MATSSSKKIRIRLSKHSIADEVFIRGVRLSREFVVVSESLAKELRRDLKDHLVAED